jgi:branched-chain amino acid transport system ATP-binding protein
VPEGRGVLTRMTVLENLQLGADAREGTTNPMSRVRAMLTRFPSLAARRDLPAGVLSGGEQQMLAIARALLAQPRLLLIDEPSLGLAPRITQEVFALLLNLRREGITVLLVEQNARKALELADRGYVLQTGRMVLSGKGPDLLASVRLQEAYLGARL